MQRIVRHYANAPKSAQRRCRELNVFTSDVQGDHRRLIGPRHAEHAAATPKTGTTTKTARPAWPAAAKAPPLQIGPSSNISFQFTPQRALQHAH